MFCCPFIQFSSCLHPLFSVRSLFLSLPSPLQFMKHIPGFIVASVRFSKSHCILLICLSFIKLGHSFFSVSFFFLLVIYTLFLDSKSVLFFLKRRGNPSKCNFHAFFQISLPSAWPSFPVVSVMQLDYKWMNIFRLRFHEPLY